MESIKQIDLFMPPPSEYGTLPYLTSQLFHALNNQGVSARLLVAEKSDPKPFLESIFNNPPNCTLSLNGILPDEKGNFLCDLIKIPHIAYLYNSPSQYFRLTHSPLTIIATPDIYTCHLFRGMGFDNALFFPHAVDKDIAPDPTIDRDLDIVMFTTFIDTKPMEERWKDTYDYKFTRLLNQAIEIACDQPTLPLMEAVVEAVNLSLKSDRPVDPKDIDFTALLAELELYLRGYDRYKIINSLKDFNLHIYGQGSPDEWQSCLGIENNHITYHPPVAYEDAIEIMKRSKIVITSHPWIRNGVHQDVLVGTACGALVISNENVYLKKAFKEGTELLFYSSNNYDGIAPLVQQYLNDESLRSQTVKNGRARVMKEHTWDHRIKSFLTQLPSLLKKTV